MITIVKKISPEDFRSEYFEKRAKLIQTLEKYRNNFIKKEVYNTISRYLQVYSETKFADQEDKAKIETAKAQLEELDKKVDKLLK